MIESDSDAAVRAALQDNSRVAGAVLRDCRFVPDGEYYQDFGLAVQHALRLCKEGSGVVIKGRGKPVRMPGNVQVRALRRAIGTVINDGHGVMVERDVGDHIRLKVLFEVLEDSVVLHGIGRKWSNQTTTVYDGRECLKRTPELISGLSLPDTIKPDVFMDNIVSLTRANAARLRELGYIGLVGVRVMIAYNNQGEIDVWFAHLEVPH